VKEFDKKTYIATKSMQKCEGKIAACDFFKESAMQTLV